MAATSNRFIRLTPPGRGAVASLRIEGAKAVEIVESLFHARNGKSLRACPADRLVLGRFDVCDGEDVVVRRCGEAAVEIHCHGGRAAIERLENLLATTGFAAESWPAWIHSQSGDAIAADAAVALAEASTERMAAVLLDQLGGALQREMDAIRQAVSHGEAAAAKKLQQAILDRAEFGRHLTVPWRVALIGRPNVGKSSLLNAMAGCTRAIVHESPGTTRDVVQVEAAIEGLPIALLDTAGLRETHDAIERAGVDLAERHAEAANLVLLVSDLSSPWTPDDQMLAARWPDALWIHNKSDLTRETSGRPKGICASAANGDGIAALLAAIVHRLVPNPPPRGAAVPFTPEQIATVQRLTTC